MAVLMAPVSARSSSVLVLLISLGTACVYDVDSVQVRDLAGRYEGSWSGRLTILGLSYPVSGTVVLDITRAQDQYAVGGTLHVPRSDASPNGYEARVDNSTSSIHKGKLGLTFKSIGMPNQSSGTMNALIDSSAACWNNGAWTISGFQASGEGSWSACRK